jgi:hypothetical protein
MGVVAVVLQLLKVSVELRQLWQHSRTPVCPCVSAPGQAAAWHNTHVVWVFRVLHALLSSYLFVYHARHGHQHRSAAACRRCC